MPSRRLKRTGNSRETAATQQLCQLGRRGGGSWMGARGGRCSDGAAGWAPSAHTTVGADAGAPAGIGISQRQRVESIAINTGEISLDPPTGAGPNGARRGPVGIPVRVFQGVVSPDGFADGCRVSVETRAIDSGKAASSIDLPCARRGDWTKLQGNQPLTTSHGERHYRGQKRSGCAQRENRDSR